MLHVEALTFGKRRFPRRVNRRLRRWLSGFLHHRLAMKAELNGVELNVVNASWTSLTCPRCWFTSKTNRSGERFKCGSCGYAGAADAIAATNILRRGSDPVITRKTSRVEVLHILEGRWRSALSDGAWGSNEGSLCEDTAESHDLDRAANNGVAIELRPVAAPVPF